MIVTFASQKGGCGKTTLAFNLAVLMKANKVINADPGKNRKTLGISLLNKARVASGLDDLCVELIQDKEQLWNEIKNAHQHPERLTIIDCGGIDSNLSRLAIGYSNLVIMPTDDSLIELGAITEFDEVLNEINALVQQKTPERHIKAHAVISRTFPTRKGFDLVKETCEKKTKNIVFTDLCFPLYVSVRDAAHEGKCVKELEPDSNSAKHLEKIASFINNYN